MSARDDLDRFDRDWENHLRWRKGSDGRAANTYRTGHVSNIDLCIRLIELPREVRDTLLAEVERLVSGELDRCHASCRADLVKRAIDEAERTLETLREKEAS